MIGPSFGLVYPMRVYPKNNRQCVYRWQVPISIILELLRRDRENEFTSERYNSKIDDAFS